MNAKPMSDIVAQRLQTAARRLGSADPLPYVKPLLDRTFYLPRGDDKYAGNTLMPGAAPLEPSFSEKEPHDLRFTVEPLGPEASPVMRRDEATREMRRLVSPVFGQEALRWFDGRSEEWRGLGSRSRLRYGAFFGTSYDRDGMRASKVYYEMSPGQIDALPPALANLARQAMQAMPSLVPLFTTIVCRGNSGGQRMTLLHLSPLRLGDLRPLLQRVGLAHQLPGLMQVMGLALGGRFELPEESVVLALGQTAEGAELKLEVMLGRIPDLPSTFLDLLALGLAEKPRELNALMGWLRAFTPESSDLPGRFSVLSVRITPKTPARVSLYLRPVEFEITGRFAESNGAYARDSLVT